MHVWKFSFTEKSRKKCSLPRHVIIEEVSFFLRNLWKQINSKIEGTYMRLYDINYKIIRFYKDFYCN